MTMTRLSIPILCFLSILSPSGCGRKRAPGLTNIVLVTIDTLRPDHCSAYGYHRPTTPFLERLAAEGVLFTRAYSTSSWTVPAMASLFTSLHPRSHGVVRGFVEDAESRIVNQSILEESHLTLPEVLREAGYRTFAVSTNAHCTPETGFGQGFDHFRSLWFQAADKANSEIRELREEISVSEPFFLWIHYFDPHAPYRARSPWIEDFAAREDLAREWESLSSGQIELRREEVVSDPAVIESLVDLYDSEIAYCDRAMEKIFSELSLLENTLVVVTSDHGESFLERNLLHHGTSLYEEQIKIPLVIRLPEGARRHRVETPVNIIDLFPTIVDLAGLDLPSGLQGRSLRREIEGEPSAGEVTITDLEKKKILRSVSEGGWKLISERNSEKPPELYNLEEDPGETRDLAVENIVERKRLEALEREWEDATPASFAPRRRRGLNRDQTEKLRALGYL